MASLKPSSSETCNKGGKHSMRGVEVLAEIFHDSDSAKEFYSDSFICESERDTQTHDDDTEEVPLPTLPPPAKEGKGKVAMKKLELTWKLEPIQPNVYQLTGGSKINPNLLCTLPEEPGPVDFFHIFIHDELVDILVRKTNRYAQQYYTWS